MSGDSTSRTVGVGAERPRTGLTLSGGGFRATLFHLGVVRFLYEEGLLSKVTHVCSVSGGSVLAAHLVLNWERYTGKLDEFDAAARELVAFIRSDLRGRVVRPWAVSILAGVPRLGGSRWWRTSLLQREYDRLYRGARLSELGTGTRPQLHLLATSFTTGHLVAFGNNEMRFCWTPGDEKNGRLPAPDFHGAGAVPVALAVAASSAFPPLFPPVRVDHTTFNVPKDQFPSPHYLTDGGVFDNLGIRRLLWLFKTEEKLDMLVVSDAQRALAAEFENDYNLTIGRTSRCVDLMMDRVSWFEHMDARLRVRENGRLLHCVLPRDEQDAVKGAFAPSPAEQLAVATARTDLDDFTDDEIDAIVHQGYASARAGAVQKGMCDAEWPKERKVWHPVRADRPSGYKLTGIDRRKWGVFRLGHWATWALWALLAWWLVVLPGGLYGYQVYRANQEEKLKKEAEKAQADAEAAQRAAEEAQRKAETEAAEKLASEKKRAADREKRRKREEAHVAKKLRLLRSLGEVALAAEEDWSPRLREWEALLTELEKEADPYFIAFLDRLSVKKAIAAVREWPHPGDTNLLVYNVAKELRDDIQNMGRPSVFFPTTSPEPTEKDEPSYLMMLRENRESLFLQAREAAKMIAKDGKKLTDTPNSRKQFWRLYWGDLILVEGPAVAGAMKNFGDLLEPWEQKGPDTAPEGLKPKLRDAAKNLEIACENELKRKP